MTDLPELGYLSEENLNKALDASSGYVHEVIALIGINVLTVPEPTQDKLIELFTEKTALVIEKSLELMDKGELADEDRVIMEQHVLFLLQLELIRALKKDKVPDTVPES